MREIVDAAVSALIVLFAALTAMVSAAVGSVYVVALAARGAWHLRLVYRGERALKDWLLARDVLIVIMAVTVGEMAAVLVISFFDLEPSAYEPVLRGLVVAFAYLGPEGVLALLPKIWRTGK